MKKIQLTSRLLSYFFKGLSWALPLVTGYFLLFDLEVITGQLGFLLLVPNVPIHNTLPFSMLHKGLLLAIQLIPLSMTLLICQALSKLFSLYERGDLFELENIRLIKRIGLLMILGQGLQLLYQPLMTAALTFNNPEGERLMSITMGSTNASALMTGLVILIASWIVKEANVLKTDSQLTI